MNMNDEKVQQGNKEVMWLSCDCHLIVQYQ